MMQITLAFADLIEGAIGAWHPINVHQSYLSQKEEAVPTIAKFLEERVPKFMGHFEDCLKSNNDGQGYMVGSRISFADVAILCSMRGYRGSSPEHFEANDKIPLLKALEQRLKEEVKIKEFDSSDKTNNVWVDSFM